MSKKGRLLVSTLSGTMAGLWLNIAAVVVSIGASGGEAPTGAFDALIRLATWPSRVVWRQPLEAIPASSVTVIVVDVLGWTILGWLAGFVADVALRRKGTGQLPTGKT